jgi:hypothetical protein
MFRLDLPPAPRDRSAPESQERHAEHVLYCAANPSTDTARRFGGIGGLGRARTCADVGAFTYVSVGTKREMHDSSPSPPN